MLLSLVDEIITCFGTAINEVFNQSSPEISPPVCLEDDEAELAPIDSMGWSMKMESHPDINYDEVPF